MQSINVINVSAMIAGLPPQHISMVSAVFGVFSIIFLSAILAGRIARLLKIPDIILFLAAGALLGPPVLGWVPISSQSPVNQLILTFGVCYILFQGGLGLSLKTMSKYALTIGLLAIPGIYISTFLIALFAKLIIPALTWPLALLLGAILSPTDPATLIPILQQIRLSERLEVVVESESAFNDATAAILFSTLISALQYGRLTLSAAVLSFGEDLVIGTATGTGLGIVAAMLISEQPIGLFRNYAAIITLPLAMSAYLLSENWGGSGYIAAFVAGVGMRSYREFRPRRPECPESLDLEYFSRHIAVICRMMLFVILGTHVDFQVIGRYWVQGVLLMAAFILVSRPAVVFTCLGIDRRNKWDLKEKIFLSWIRETGVMPAALAGTLASLSPQMHGSWSESYPGLILAMVFMAILFTLLLQALSTPWLAKRLALLRATEDTVR